MENNRKEIFCNNSDTDKIIISYILNGTQKWNFQMIKRIYIIFGKSQFINFVNLAKNYFFDILFKKYNSTNINELLQKLINKKNPHFYMEYIQFNRNINSELLVFTSLKRRSSVIVRYLALYHNFIWICVGRTQWEGLGYKYYNFHTEKENIDQIFKYSFLKQKRLHNLKYYDLVSDADNVYDRTYKLKKGAMIYKVGPTKDYLDIECIKIF